MMDGLSGLPLTQLVLVSYDIMHYKLSPCNKSVRSEHVKC